MLPADKLMTLSRTEPDAFSMSALASLLSWFAANFTSPQRSADARQTMHESVDLTEHSALSVSSSSNCTAFSDVAEARGSDLGDRLASAIARAALETHTKSPSAPTLLSKRSLVCVFVALARGAGLPCRSTAAACVESALADGRRQPRWVWRRYGTNSLTRRRWTVSRRALAA